MDAEKRLTKETLKMCQVEGCFKISTHVKNVPKNVKLDIFRDENDSKKL